MSPGILKHKGVKKEDKESIFLAFGFWFCPCFRLLQRQVGSRVMVPRIQYNVARSSRLG